MATVLALTALAVPAFAQDGDSGGEGASAAWRFEARALDYSTMLEQSHGGGAPANDVALSRVPVTVVVNAPGQSMARTYETQTDLVGKFVVQGDRPPPGATLEFLVPSERGAEGRPGFFARSWTVDDEPAPEKVDFYEVAESADDLFLGQVVNVVTTVQKDANTRVIQFRHTAMLQNIGFKVWVGDFSAGAPVSFAVPIPDGFELRHATVDNRDLPLDSGRAGHAGIQSFIHREPIFPTGFQSGLVFQIMSVAPYVDGSTYDASWHVEYPLMNYSLNIEESTFHYVQPESSEAGLVLTDGGVQPAMGNTKIVTHAYTAQQVRAHSTIAAVFTAGRPIPWRPVLWTSAIALLVVGAAFIGLAASRKDAVRTKEVESAQARVKVPATAEGREHELEMLARRLKRGEITSIEHQVRKAAIDNAGRSAPARTGRAKPPPQQRAAVSPGLQAQLTEIAARTDDATPEQLRADVRTLARAVQDLLGG